MFRPGTHVKLYDFGESPLYIVVKPFLDPWDSLVNDVSEAIVEPVPSVYLNQYAIALVEQGDILLLNLATGALGYEHPHNLVEIS